MFTLSFRIEGINSTFINEINQSVRSTVRCSFIVAYEIKKYSCFLQIDRVYVSSPNRIAVLDHERKRTYLIRKEGLPDTGKYLNLTWRKKMSSNGSIH